MANYQLNVATVSINGINERMFEELFGIDSDYSENENYFREDTLELGFENEAQRCSKEYYKKFRRKFDRLQKKDFDDDMFIELIEEFVEKCVNDTSIDGSNFILGNSTYTSDYKITYIYNDDCSYGGIDYDGETKLVISYMTY